MQLVLTLSVTAPKDGANDKFAASSEPVRRLSKRPNGERASCESISGGTSGYVDSCRFAMAPLAPASWRFWFNGKTYVDRRDPCGGNPRGRRQRDATRRI